MKRAIPDAVLSQHLALLGKTGRGKTNTAKVCVEQVYDQEFRVCILDTLKSDWWGITSSADGRRPGLPFHILGGPHAHFPLASSMGKAVADLVARGELRHTIVDMAEFEPGGQMRFFTDFAPRLMQRMKGVLYLVIEEAHILAPKERSGIGHENMSIHWAKVLATAGRTKGIRLLILSQRTQAVHNAILGSCDSMIVHGMTAPADMEPVTKWLKANNKDKALNATIEGSLSGLAPGEAWLCSSEARVFERVQMPKARTYDNTATPTDDEELREVKTAPVDAEKLRAILGKAAADAEANDPKSLRKRIAELETATRQGPPAATVDEHTITALRYEGFLEGHSEGFLRGINECNIAAQRAFDECTATTQRIQQGLGKSFLAAKPPIVGQPMTLKRLREAARKPPKHATLTPSNPPLNKAGREEVDTKMAKAINRELTTNGGFGMASVKREGEGYVEDPGAITGLKLEILKALHWFEQQGIRPTPRQALAGMVGKTLDKGYGARTLGEMKTQGFVTYPTPGNVEMTSASRDENQWAPPQHASLYEAWFERFSGLQREVLVILKDNHPQPVSRGTLGEMVGKTLDKGYGARALGEMKTLGAIYYPQPGLLALTQYVIP